MGTATVSSPSLSAGVPAAPARPRLDHVDWLRGLVMVVMALDHVRDFFGDMTFDAIDPHQTTVRHFFTRWVTHYCAPTFIFLTGVGAYLYASRGKTKPQLAWFLLTRGLWLVFLELTIIRFFWTAFDLSYAFIPLGVFWSIGTSMVLMAPIVLLPDWLVGTLGLLIVVGHNALDRYQAADFGRLDWLWILLHAPGEIRLFADPVAVARDVTHLFPAAGTGARGVAVFTAYKIAWVGTMMAGYGFGRVQLWERSQRRRFTALLGLALVVGFVALRGSNAYGDPRPRLTAPDPKAITQVEAYRARVQSQGGTPTVNPPLPAETFTALSFLNCEKYPPSLCFLLMTLGPALLMLAAADRPPGPAAQFFVTFGRVPLFYYLLHIAVIVPAAAVTYLVMAKGNSVSVEALQSAGGPRIPLWGVYLLWIAVVAVLYPACRWFAGVKARSKSPWLSYL